MMPLTCGFSLPIVMTVRQQGKQLLHLHPADPGLIPAPEEQEEQRLVTVPLHQIKDGWTRTKKN